MNIILFSHPPFLTSVSMPRFADMIATGMRTKGHTVEIWNPEPLFFNLPLPKQLKKWPGYIDQFAVFSWIVKKRLRHMQKNTIFVFSDQALGPWVPLVADKPHAVHVHDFMALRSALGEFPQNPVSWTGRMYQNFIRAGFSHGRTFVSVSHNTRKDLHRLLNSSPAASHVVHNGLNHPFRPLEKGNSIRILQQFRKDLPHDFLLHVGGNQWYKNRTGVVEIYRAYCQLVSSPLPLLMIGATPPAPLLQLSSELPPEGRVLFLQGVPTNVLHAAYCLAHALLFPSIAEGFGWPIAEAMACGCPVLTTGAPPMSEVGGDAASYIPVMPYTRANSTWAEQGAQELQTILLRDSTEREMHKEAGFLQAAQFSTQQALDKYEAIYQQTLNGHDQQRK